LLQKQGTAGKSAAGQFLFRFNAGIMQICLWRSCGTGIGRAETIEMGMSCDKAEMQRYT
jgi:hypothetical protein